MFGISIGLTADFISAFYKW